MSSNVGLSTPRGSGTSGYVQRNLAHMRPRDYGTPYPQDAESRHKLRQPDKEILEHDAKREVELKVIDLQDELEEEASLDEDEIEKRCDEFREKLLAELKRGGGGGRAKRSFKSHEVHGMADAKIKESERLRSALKISKDYQEGDHWRRQDERERGLPEEGRDRERERAKE